MSVNTMNLEQLSTTLNAINSQATGKTGIAPTTADQFVSVAQATLAAGYDPVLQAISQVVGQTIFSVRPYSRKFSGIKHDARKWGGITRKLAVVDKPFENSQAFNLTDGSAIDQWVVNKPEVLETIFTGSDIYQKSLTIFRNQLDTAFKGPDEFGQFISMITQNASDMIEQAHESTARMTIANFIAGKNIIGGDGVVHLLTEYNTATGNSYTAHDIVQPDKYPGFIKWVYARIAGICAMMTERTLKFQQNITGKEIARHTPYDRQKVYLFAPDRFGIEAQVLADTYHDNYLKMAETETVNFWQSVDTPDEVQCTPVYLQTDGTLATGAAQTVSPIFGVIFDEEALGYVTRDEIATATGLNARGLYSNLFWSFNESYWNDFSEPGVVLLLD